MLSHHYYLSSGLKEACLVDMKGRTIVRQTANGRLCHKRHGSSQSYENNDQSYEDNDQSSRASTRRTRPRRYYVVINVSGRRFKAEERLLEKYPETLLGGERRYCYFDNNKDEYFFDRDPDIFPHILKFYRSGHLHCPENECAELFENEVRFFGIAESVSLCCLEQFELDKGKMDNYRQSQFEQERIRTIRAQRLKDFQSFKEKLWFIIEQPALSVPGFALWIATTLFILATVISLVMESVPAKDGKTWGESHRTGFNLSECICVLYFTLEYILKLYSTPHRWKFVKQVSNIIDLLSILPYYVGLVSGNRANSRFFVILRVLRVTRVIKISRFSAEKMQQHGNLLKQNKGELTPLLLCFATFLIVFSTVIYHSETKYNSKFPNIPACFWYTIVTMTSLGYGDVVPQTIPGMLVGALCSISGIFLIALMAPLLQKG